MHALIQKRQTDNKLDGEVKDTTVSSAAEILVDNNSAGDIVDALMNTNNILQKHIQQRQDKIRDLEIVAQHAAGELQKSYRNNCELLCIIKSFEHTLESLVNSQESSMRPCNFLVGINGGTITDLSTHISFSLTDDHNSTKNDDKRYDPVQNQDGTRAVTSDKPAYEELGWV